MKFMKRKKGMIKGYPRNVAIALSRSSLRLEWLLRFFVLAVAGLLFFWGWRLDVADKGFKVGLPSPRDYYVLSDVTYLDEETTRQLKENLASRVLGVTVIDVSMVPIVRAVLEDIENPSSWSYLPESLVNILKALPSSKRGRILDVTRNIGLQMLSLDNYGGSSTDLKGDLWRYLANANLSVADKNIVYQILSYLLAFVVDTDSEATALVREFYKSSVELIEKALKPGMLLVKKGELITPEIANLLRLQGYPESRFPRMQLSMVLFMVFLWSFLHRYTDLQEWRQTSTIRMVYFSALLILGWVVQFGVARLNALYSGIGILPIAGWGYLTLPYISAFYLGLSGGLLGVMISSSNSFAYLYSMLLAVLITVLAHAVFKERPTTRGKAFLKIELVGFVAVALWYAFSGVFYHVPPLRDMLFVLLLLLCLGGAFILLLPLIERTFDVVSPIRLMELTHPSNALLKRLQVEAPGTYHHSMMVSTLAEAAAEQIRANALLVRGGAYYHDIGKLKRPQYFIENQIEGENIHDTLSPSLSALIILSHVQEGINLAKEYGLPSAMIDFIAEHHGTTCLSYFYNKAKRNGDHVDRDQYCYPGPKPRSRETALLMLADSVEAAVRALGPSVLDLPALDDAVKQVIEVKKQEGQLDEVNLTMKDLSNIRQAFVTTLMSMYHTRWVKDKK